MLHKQSYRTGRPFIFCHSLNKHSLGVSNVPDTVLGAGNNGGNREKALTQLTVQGGRKIRNKQAHTGEQTMTNYDKNISKERASVVRA